MTTTPLKSLKTKASSMTTTPSKSSKHRFEVENEFNDDHAFEEKTKASSMTTTPLKSSKHWFEVENEFKDDHVFEEIKDESEFNDDHAFEEFKVETEFDWVQKFIRLIFIYYKSEVSGRSGPEIQTRPAPRIDC